MTSAPVAAAAAAPAVSDIFISYMHILIHTYLWQWRQFSFFDVVPVKDVHDLASPPEIFKVRLHARSIYSYLTLVPQNAPEISTVSSSSTALLVADIHGSIHSLNKDFESARSWVAHVGGRVTHMLERKGILVTLGVRGSLMFD